MSSLPRLRVNHAPIVDWLQIYVDPKVPGERGLAAFVLIPGLRCLRHRTLGVRLTGAHRAPYDPQENISHRQQRSLATTNAGMVHADAQCDGAPWRGLTLRGLPRRLRRHPLHRPSLRFAPRRLWKGLEGVVDF